MSPPEAPQLPPAPVIATPAASTSRTSRFETVKSWCELLSYIATIAGLLIIIVQLHDAKADVAASLEEARVNRTAEWVARLVGSDEWDRMATTYLYLHDPTIDSATKRARLHSDDTLRSAIVHTLAEMELLAYMYNADKIDRELLRHGPRRAIIDYYEAVVPWIGDGYGEIKRMAAEDEKGGSDRR